MKAKPILLETKGHIEDIQGSLVMRNNKLFTSAMLNSAMAHKKIPSDKVFEIYLIDTEATLLDSDVVLVNGKTYNNEIHIFREEPCPPPDVTNRNICDKIIACTDKSLHNLSDVDRIEDFEIPQLSEQSVKALIDYYNQHNKMPDEVDVEEDMGFADGRHFKNGDENDPDVMKWIILNSEGTIDITMSKKKMYSYEEMCSSMQQYLDEYVFTEGNYKTPQNWIKENLK